MSDIRVAFWLNEKPGQIKDLFIIDSIKYMLGVMKHSDVGRVYVFVAAFPDQLTGYKDKA